MKMYTSKYFLIFICMLALAAPLTADTQLVSVAVPITKEIESAVGIIFNGQESQQIDTTEITRVSDELALVQFPFSTKELPANTLASAVVKNIDGTVAYGTVRSLTSPGPKDSFYSLPLCPEDPPSPTLQGQMSALEQLITVRSNIRRNREKQLQLLLDPETSAQILKLEQGFGLDGHESLSLSAHPLDLIERLSRLHNAVKNYRIHKEKRLEAERGL